MPNCLSLCLPIHSAPQIVTNPRTFQIYLSLTIRLGGTCWLTRLLTDLPSFNELYRSATQTPQSATLQDISRSATPSIVPGLGPAEFPPLIPSQTSAAKGTTATKTIKPAIPTIHRSETTRNMTKVLSPEATRTAQSKEHQNLTAADNADINHGDSSNKSTASTRDMTESPLGATSQVEVDAGSSSRPEAITSKSETTPATESKDKLITKEPIADMGTSSEPKSSVSTVQGAGMTSTSATLDSAEIQSPVPIRNPRTLRLVTAVKAEDSSTSSTPADTATTTSEVFTPKPMTQDSDFPSAKQPSTPVAEIISEDASLASASASQPGTPNLSSRIHAGPSGIKSKNQIKKERHARAKQLEELKAEEVSLTDESVQAPIIGRKKKIKKAKPAVHATTDPQVSPTVRNLQSDSIQSSIETASTPVLEEHSSAAIKAEPPNLDHAEQTRDEEHDGQSIQQRKLTGSSILANLKAEGILDASNLEYFLNPAGLNTRHDVSTSHLFRYELTPDLDEEEKEILNCGDCIVRPLNPGEWGVVLPDRSVLRHLSKEEAIRYMNTKFELDHNGTDTFNATDYPREAWMNLTGNDVLTGLQVAPPLDGMQNNHHHSNSGTTESLLGEFASTLVRPDGKDVSYGALYPPRDQAENEEIEARMSMYTLEEAEQTVKASEELLLAARKETEQLEKKLQAVVKKNRKILKDWQEKHR